MDRRIAVAALVGVILCAQGLLSPCGAPAAEAPIGPPPPSGKSLPAGAGPAAPVPAVPAPSTSDNAVARDPGAPGVSVAAVPPRAPAVPAPAPPGAAVGQTVSLVAPPSEKAPDRVLSPGEVDLQVNRNLGEDAGAEGTIPDDFFANASEEVGKGEDGMFAGISRPIDKFIRYFQTRGRDRFELYLSRSGKYVEMMRGILAKYGLPEDLVYLALIESGFSPHAYSVAKAAGPWQFIAATGRRYGLRIDWWADERRDAEKSTHAAASYLKDLYGMFESWPLAAAAYNAGEGKIIKAVHRYKSDDYAELIRYRYLKQETKDYVPKMLAALAIAKEPEKYGFRDVRYEAPLDLRTVEVPGGTDLSAVSEILEVPYDTLREWNPELRRFCTPPNRERYLLRLSGDAALRAEERMEEIRTRAKITFLQHNVRKGETLQGLAGKYGTSAAVLKELNGLKRDSLSRTSRLVIPVTGLSGDEAMPGKEISPDQLTMAHMRVEEGGRKGKRKGRPGPDAGDSVTVRKGDTLSGIARAHGVPAKELARANNLSPGAKLKAGSRLVLPEEHAVSSPAAAKKGTAASAQGGGKRTARYKVHRGDTLERIARVYGVTPERLAARNRMKPGDTLRTGTVLVIPLES